MITSSFNKGWSAVEAADESAATLVTVVILLKNCSGNNVLREMFNVADTSKRIDDWGIRRGVIRACLDLPAITYFSND